MRIILLRHAQTRGNLRSNYIGGTDEPLSPQGIAIARSAPRREDVRSVHTSTLRRTAETANILYPNAAIIPHAGLNEMHFGDFEGKNFRGLEADPAYAAWLATRCEAPCPNGESKEEFTRRCRESFSAVLSEERAAGTDEIHFVVHGGTIMAIMSGFVTPPRGYFDWRAGFCGGYMIESEEDCFPLRETIPPPERKAST